MNKCCAVCAFVKDKKAGVYYCPIRGDIKGRDVFSRSCAQWKSKESGIKSAEEAFENAKNYLDDALKELFEVRNVSDKNYEAYIEVLRLIKKFEEITE
jgi:uncharacterized Zn finger protein (UPF0148 family)